MSAISVVAERVASLRRKLLELSNSNRLLNYRHTISGRGEAASTSSSKRSTRCAGSTTEAPQFDREHPACGV